MSNASVLIEKIHKRREFKQDLGDGKSVTLRRPPEAEFFGLARGFGVEQIARYTVGWAGFTEADLYAGGGSDEVEFDAELWREVVADRADWLGLCGQAIADAMKRRSDERKAAQGN
jgi:hypothetical protein